MAARFEKLRDAKKELARRKALPRFRFKNLTIYDLKKTHPRIKRRYLVGSYFDYLET